jgi:hypothetical protein
MRKTYLCIQTRLYGMIRKIFAPLFVFLSVITNLNAQDTTYRYPLDIPPLISATFGELRPNHFHAGMDFKTNGETGHRVHAVADGYIYRIKVQKGGYGKTVYIKHPDGKISVYAHLEKFAGDLENYVKLHQYEEKKFFIQLFPGESLFPVQKGQIIGYSGNTGASMGPHLHFEIRDGENFPVNPMQFGLTIEDTIAPVLRNLFVYPLNDTSSVNQSRKQIKPVRHATKHRLYIFEPVTAYGEIGLGIDAYDQSNNTYNKNGLYEIRVKVNGTEIYRTRMDKISYSTTRNINVFIDYPYYVHHRRYIQWLWRHPEAKIPVFKSLVNKGKIPVEDGKNYHVEIFMSDFYGNTSRILLDIRGKKEKLPPAEVKKTPFYVRKNKPFRIHTARTDVFFPPRTFYDDLYIHFSEFPGGFELTPGDVPVRKNFTVKYSLEKIPGNKKKSAYLARVNPRNGKAYFYTAYKKNDSIILKTRLPGKYIIRYDSIPPVIYRINFPDKKWISNYRYLRFRMKDNTGIRSVNAYIDGKWILIEWDYKTGKAFYDFNDLKFPGTKHQLKIVVTDKTGNKTKKTLTFYRKFK